MSYSSRLLFRSLVKPFYRENMSIFFFFATILVFSVGEVDGAELFAFHYSLARGILQNSGFLLVVFAAWFLYTRKFAAYVTGSLRQPQYGFTAIYNNLPRPLRFRLLLRVEVWLLLPILAYAVFISVIGIYRHWIGTVAIIWGYLLILAVGTAIGHMYVLNDLSKKWGSFLRLSWIPPFYPTILLRFVAHRQRILWLGIKLFTCGVLYGIARNNTVSDYDAKFPFLFFNFGVLANGMIVYGIRDFEETRLSFYRSMAVPLSKRLLEYWGVYLILMLPELITLARLKPEYLHASDAQLYGLCAYGSVLLMNGICFLRHFSKREYFMVVLMGFCIEYFFMGATGLLWLAICLFAAAIISFLSGYYRFGRQAVN